MDKLKKVFSPGHAKDDEVMYAKDSTTSDRAPIAGISGEGSHFPHFTSKSSPQNTTQTTADYGAGDVSTGYQTTGIPAADDSVQAARVAMENANTTDTSALADSTAVPATSAAAPTSSGLVHSTIHDETPSGHQTSSDLLQHDVDSTPPRTTATSALPATHTPPIAAATSTGDGQIPDTGKYDDSRGLASETTFEDPSKTIPYDTLEQRAIESDPTASSTGETHVTTDHSTDATAFGAAGVGGLGGAIAGSAAADSTDTGPASKTIGPHESNLANIVDPRVQPEPAIQAQTLKSASETAPAASVDTGPASKTIGPHESNLANIVDPRVQPEPAVQAQNLRSASSTGPATNTTSSIDSPYSAKEIDPRVDSLSAGGDGTADTKKSGGILGIFKSSKSKDAEAEPTTSESAAQEETHYGRDAAIVGGAGVAAGAVGYAATRSDDRPAAVPSATTTQTTAVPTTTTQTSSVPTTTAAQTSSVPTASTAEPEEKKKGGLLGIFKSKSKDSETEPTTSTAPAQDDSHYGRDAALVGGAGAAAGAVGYAATRSDDQPSSVPTTSTAQTSSVPTTDTTESEEKKKGGLLGIFRSKSKDTEAEPTTSTASAQEPSIPAQEQTHYGRDAAIVGGTGVAAGAAGYAANRSSDQQSSIPTTSTTDNEAPTIPTTSNIYNQSSVPTTSTTEPEEKRKGGIFSRFKSDKSKDTDADTTEDDTHYGRDAAILGGAGVAAGAAGYAATRPSEEPSAAAVTSPAQPEEKKSGGILSAFKSDKTADTEPKKSSTTSDDEPKESKRSKVLGLFKSDKTKDTETEPTSASAVPVEEAKDKDYGRDAGIAAGALGAGGVAAGGAYEYNKWKNEGSTNVDDTTATAPATTDITHTAPQATDTAAHDTTAPYTATDTTAIPSTTADSSIPQTTTAEKGVTEPQTVDTYDEKYAGTQSTDQTHYGRDAAIVGGTGVAGAAAGTYAADHLTSSSEAQTMAPSHQYHGDSIDARDAAPIGTASTTDEAVHSPIAGTTTADTSETHYGRDAAIVGGGAAVVGGAAAVAASNTGHYDERDRELASTLSGHQNFGDKERERRSGSDGFLGLFKNKDQTSEDTATSSNKLQKTPPAEYTSSKETPTAAAVPTTTTTTTLPDRSVDNTTSTTDTSHVGTAAGLGAAGLGAGTAAYAAEHHHADTTTTSQAAPSRSTDTTAAATTADSDTVIEPFTGLPMNIGKYGTTGAGGTDGGPMEGAPGMADAAAAAKERNTVVEPFTGLPMDVRKYGSVGKGGTDGAPIEGAVAGAGESAEGGTGHVTDWEAIRKANTPY